MASTVTQFVRNFACVLKSLLPYSHGVHKIAFPKATAPFNKVSNIELFISVTQFAAVCFNIMASYADTIQGFRDYRRSGKFLVGLDRLTLSGGSTVGSAEYTFLRHSLQNDKTNAITKFWIGICEFFIGCVFMFLVANSLHLHGPTHPKPVMDALILQELALAYILTVMWKSFMTKMISSLKTRSLAKKLQTLKPKQVTPSKIIELAADSGYLHNIMDIIAIIDPSFRCAYPSSFSMAAALKDDLTRLHDLMAITAKSEQQEPLITPELTSTSQDLTTSPRYGLRSRQRKADDKNDSSVSTMENLASDSQANQHAFTQEHLNELVYKLNVMSQMHIYEMVVSFVLFSLNLIAGYGYMMGILSFNFPAASLSSSNPGNYIAKMLMFDMSNASADWWGNFCGDLAWTIEPVVVLINPYVTAFVRQVSACSLI
ncbi:hypothetical protein EON65_23355 [archaeon]|nr:MAG: hypothetical protein EON65_23355 [archaeon]